VVVQHVHRWSRVKVDLGFSLICTLSKSWWWKLSHVEGFRTHRESKSGEFGKVHSFCLSVKVSERIAKNSWKSFEKKRIEFLSFSEIQSEVRKEICWNGKRIFLDDSSVGREMSLETEIRAWVGELCCSSWFIKKLPFQLPQLFTYTTCCDWIQILIYTVKWISERIFGEYHFMERGKLHLVYFLTLLIKERLLQWVRVERKKFEGSH